MSDIHEGKITNSMNFKFMFVLFNSYAIFHSSEPQPFWHQGLIPWKTLFPWPRDGGNGFRMIWEFIAYFIAIIITSALSQIIRHGSQHLGTPVLQYHLLSYFKWRHVGYLEHNHNSICLDNCSFISVYQECLCRSCWYLKKIPS